MVVTMLGSYDPSRLSKSVFVAILVTVVAIFLWVDNPLSGNPYDIDRSIFWSYLPIPVLVLVALILEGKIGFRSLFLDTLEMFCLKFAVTYGIAISSWMIWEPPVQPEVSPSYKNVPEDILLINRGISITHKRRADGPTHQVVLWGEGTQKESSELKIDVGEALVLVNRDSQLHTAMALDPRNTILFNRPLLPRKEPIWVYFDKPFGQIRVVCAVHPFEELSLHVGSRGKE